MSGSSKKRIAIGALVVILGAALWWVVRPGERAGTRSVAGSTRTGSGGGGSRWLPWLGGGSRKGNDPSGIPDPYKGPRIPVRVKVIDVSGDPVSGVRVEARVDPNEWEYAGLSDEEYDEYVASKDPEPEEAGDIEEDEPLVLDDDAWRIVRKPVDTGRTGRDGVFISRLKPDVDVVFHARDGEGREGISPLLYVYEREAAEEGEEDLDPYYKDGGFEVTIELAELGILAGVVVDDRGRPIAGADVTLSAWSGDLEHDELIASAEPEHRTGEDGSFRIPLRASGAFDVEVHAKKYQPAMEQAVQVLPGRETSLNITMMPSAEMAGVVLDPRGNPVAGARVLVQGQPSVNEYVSTEAYSQDDGRFLVEELAPGRYTVAAIAQGFRPTELWEVAAGQGEIVLRLTQGGAIRGDVLASPDLARVSPHHSRMIEEHGEDWSESGDPNDTGPLFYGDVYIALSGEQPEAGEPMPPGIPLATGVPKGRELESPSGTLDVRGRYFAQLIVDKDGRGTFDVGGLPPGTYDVTVMVGAAVSRRSGVRVWDGGTATLSMEVPDRGAASIAGTIRSSDGRPLKEANVFLYGSLPSGMSAWADENGRFEFRSVPAGEYMVHAAATVASTADASMLVTAYVPTATVVVPAGGRVPLELVATPSDLPSNDAGTLVDGLDMGDVLIDGEIEIGIDEHDHEGDHADDETELWMPDVWIEEIDAGLVVTYSPPAPDGKRLFGGDRVTSIDGATVSAMESWEALELLYGPKGSLCRITVERPATRETIAVSLPRDKNAYEMEGHIY